jgi:hypothetical protein
LPPKIEVEMRNESSFRKPRKGSEEDYRSLKLGNFKERVYKFIEIELLKKENFFLELARIFCARFSQKYENDVVRWSAHLKDVKSHTDIVTSHAGDKNFQKNLWSAPTGVPQGNVLHHS